MDYEVIKKCLLDDRKSQEQFYKLCYPLLIGTCLKYSSDKEKVIWYLNMGFAKILMNLKQYEEGTYFEFWAKKVLTNTILDELRKEKRQRNRVILKEDLSELKVNQNNYSDSEYDQTRIELIKTKASKLPPTTKKVFDLYAIEGYKHHEIADMLNMNEKTSMWHYSEARKRIKEMLKLQ